MAEIDQALEYLKKHDPILASVIASHKKFEQKTSTDYYYRLVRAIIGQQLSVKAAASIEKRFLNLFDGVLPSPVHILEKSNEELRQAGLSNAKASYVKDLARHIIDGRLQLERLPELSNEEVIKELMAVKGIGGWTAHMFLMFALGRLDILPVGDLGIRSGIKRLYGLEELPTPAEVRLLADKNGWHPYESIVSWYIWRSLDDSSK